MQDMKTYFETMNTPDNKTALVKNALATRELVEQQKIQNKIMKDQFEELKKHYDEQNTELKKVNTFRNATIILVGIDLLATLVLAIFK